MVLYCTATINCGASVHSHVSLWCFTTPQRGTQMLQYTAMIADEALLRCNRKFQCTAIVAYGALQHLNVKWWCFSALLL